MRFVGLSLVVLPVLAAVLTSATAARAEPVVIAGAPALAPAPAPRFDPTATVSIEPVFLVAGIVEANLEVKVAPHVGLQVLGGYGGFLTGTISELGTEVNVYARREVSGFHAGAMAKLVKGSSSLVVRALEMDQAEDVKERELGVYAGWKWIGWHHLTAVLQGGVGRLDLTGGVDGPQHQVIPVANFTAGYSF